MFFSKLLIGIGILVAQCFLKTSCAITATKREQSDMGLFYGCAFHGMRREDVGNTKADWTVNGVNAKHFENHFQTIETNDNTGTILYSYLRILNPVALRGPTEIKCSVGGGYTTFKMNNVVVGNPVNFRFPKGNLRTDWINKCDEWQGTMVGCENSTCECALKAMEIIDFTSREPIRKNPFVAFEIVDKTLATQRKDLYMKNYVAYVNTNNDENPNEKWGSEGQTKNWFNLKSKGNSIKPDVQHDVVIRHFGPMWNRDMYAPCGHFVEDHFKLKTSSHIPGKPTIWACDLHRWKTFHFHFNSVAEEEISTFVPKLYKNGVVDPNAVLKGANLFELEVSTFKVNDTFKIKIHSTEEKYNSVFSNTITIDLIEYHGGYVSWVRYSGLWT